MKTMLCVTCQTCSNDVPFAISSLSLDQLRGLRLLIDDAIKAATPEKKSTTEAEAVEFEWRQGILHQLFVWKMEYPGGLPDVLPAESYPPQIYREYFTGKNPSAQFGLWMYHRSKDAFTQPGLYVRHRGWSSNKRLYDIAFLLHPPTARQPQEHSASL